MDAIATLIVTVIMDLLGVDPDDYAMATRRDGSIIVVGLNDEADAVFRDNADKIREASTRAGNAFVLEMVKGFPVLTNRHG